VPQDELCAGLDASGCIGRNLPVQPFADNYARAYADYAEEDDHFMVLTGS
jgi:hypothetical protein